MRKRDLSAVQEQIKKNKDLLKIIENANLRVSDVYRAYIESVEATNDPALFISIGGLRNKLNASQPWKTGEYEHTSAVVREMARPMARKISKALRA
jgi:hypothetical protein